MPKAIAIANNDVAQIAWQYDAKIPNCLGFAVERKEGPADGEGGWVPLPAWVGFTGQSNAAWTAHTTLEWPIQKFEWRDLTATRGKTYSYRIIPVSGNPDAGGDLTADLTNAVVTDPVTLTPVRGSFATYFNRGILSTQFLAHQIPAGPSGAPDFAVLTNRIDQPGDPLRNALAGQMIEGVALLLKRAIDQGGACYLALYELTDPELMQSLLAGGDKVHIILSNTGKDDSENQPARQALHAQAGIDITDRFVPSGHIGHNKFCIYMDAAGTPQAVLLGSTNWTDTALCAQSNNALIAENPDIAAAYYTYWQRLKADCDNDDSKQGPDLRTADQQPGVAGLAVDGAQATVWFAPNTDHPRRSKPGADEAVPPDLAQVFALMSAARQAILFLEFEPGSPSVVDHAADCLNDNPNLFVRGAVTDPKAVGNFTTTLTHRGGDETNVVAASAINDQFAFWQHELLKAGPSAHAIIHDKIVVIDPMSPNCVVITGSHNQGYRASYNNDENLLIVQGHQALAQAYAVHVLDVYDHYRFRALMDKQGNQAFSGLQRDDGWQDRYFAAGDPTQKDQGLWFPAGQNG
jgi:phosphatidylserine/phosphatidylglycerophosphate/cardiolipin synthase-like enzyme